MLNSQYLSTSRHGVYYFRFNIPQTLHPDCKQTTLRLFLATRCPREALRLSRMLSYAGEHILRQAGMRRMDYQQIKAVLHEHFRCLLERQALQGPLSKTDRVAITLNDMTIKTPSGGKFYASSVSNLVNRIRL